MWWLKIQTCLLLVVVSQGNHHRARHVWTWKCNNSSCDKNSLADGENPQSLPVCKQICDKYANLWPQPTGDLHVSKNHVSVNPHSVSVEYSGRSQLTDKVGELIQEAGRLFKRHVGKEAGVENLSFRTGAQNSLYVQLDIIDTSLCSPTLSTDESYKLIVSTDSNINQVKAIISANNFFGARCGLETLNQLIIYDDYLEALVIPDFVRVIDKPVYSYRGILLDTSRSYYSIHSIKRTLDAMAANKLNRFHWHMTDTHSFPYQSEKYPLFSRYGAYAPNKIYTCKDIKEVVEYARVRGIRVIPELDQPAHVGEGWQWAPNTTVCYKAEPWQSYCVEPPCGQLDPTNEDVYKILCHLYTEYLECFDPDIFHMGGDEVNFNCWNSSEHITQWMSENGLNRSQSDFLRLWNGFQNKSYAKLIEANGGKELPVILWTSDLTAKGEIEKNLHKDKYIIQIWTKGDDSIVPYLVEKGYRVIFSNYDALYMDCGFGAWVGTGNNWCSPYIPWQTVYNNDPRKLVGNGTSEEIKRELVLGAETTLFSEEADETSVDSRLWPRTCAMAERLWSRPKGNWTDALWRILDQRQRMVKRGIMADLLQPEWCRQNSGHCYL